MSERSLLNNESHISSTIQSGVRKLLFFSLERWDFVWRRNQFICASLIERYPDALILWVNPPYDPLFSHALKSAGKISLTPQPVSEHPGIYVIDLIKPLPSIIGARLNQYLYVKALQKALAILQFDQFTIWVNNQSMRSAIPSLGKHHLIYDITDDWTAANLPERVLKRTREDDIWLLKTADEVIVCSPHLFELKKGIAQSLHLIPNGVHWHLYHTSDKTQQLPREYLQMQGPIVGYVGTLHDDRLDVPLLLELSAMLPKFNFILLGPDHLSKQSRSKIEARANITIIGARPYCEIPLHLAAFSVLIVPHLITPFTESLDPLKLYEYMATAKPIVATACAGFRDIVSPYSVIASDSKEFVDAVRKCSQLTDSLIDHITWAKAHSWSNRIDSIESLLGWS